MPTACRFATLDGGCLLYGCLFGGGTHDLDCPVEAVENDEGELVVGGALEDDLVIGDVPEDCQHLTAAGKHGELLGKEVPSDDLDVFVLLHLINIQSDKVGSAQSVVCCLLDGEIAVLAYLEDILVEDGFGDGD